MEMNGTAAADEVIVVGYGSRSKRIVTGSISSVDMTKQPELPNTNITQALRGKVAGIQFIDNGRPGQDGSILIRGRNSLSAASNPLVVLDGIIFNGSLTDINPNDIQSIDILKDASSASIYGSRAANGVILVTSKKGMTEKPSIRINAFQGFSDPTYKVKLLDPERYLERVIDYRTQTGVEADPSKIATYITKTVIEELLFLDEQNRKIGLFKDDLKEIDNFIELFMYIMHFNTVSSGNGMSFSPILVKNSWSVHMVYNYDDQSTCLCFYHHTRCSKEATITHSQLYNKSYVYKYKWKVPGFVEGCYPFWGLIRSQLFCLYNKSCLFELIDHLEATFQVNISTLKEHSSSSIFNSSTSIGELLSKMMVEQWDQNISYEKYYKKCQPKQCQYTYIKKFHINYMISTILGITGGLSLSLRIIVPYLIQLIENIWKKFRNKDNQNNDPIDCRTQIKIILSKIVILIQNFNLFEPRFERIPSIPILEHEKQLKRKLQILSTRIYAFILVFFAITIIIYSSLRRTAETKVFSISSYSDYQSLLIKYPLNKLSCPCSSFTIKYSNFLSIKPKSMHPACHNRIFVPNWTRLRLGFDLAPIEENSPFVFIFYLQLSSYLCHYAMFLIENQSQKFLETLYATSFLTNEEEFKKYFKLQINQFPQSISSYYKRFLQIIKLIISGNSLLTASKTNYEWDFINITGNQMQLSQFLNLIQLKTKSKIYNNKTYSCNTLSKFYQYPLYYPESRIPIPGFYLSCYFIDGLFKSTFECFYNITCLQFLRIQMNSPYNLVSWKLNLSSNSFHYQINSTVKELFDILFVEEWFNETNYQLYYEQCQPKECFYTFVTKFQFRYIITTIVNIINGLSKSLFILIPFLVKICFILWKYFKKRKYIRQLKRNNRIKPTSPSLST
ncbi:unnamed protein product [Adineta ricciae]|uniref:TonB-dependent receptor plug domain-containing protein n=1 Tax=Adineta ricciae TaxID=249248 RepID=A0A815JGE0_ADIRI|nr:unnamed protein product [Adineta ricciae]CAF1647926.1 unnamed protein product [Adineta ricciae]